MLEILKITLSQDLESFSIINKKAYIKENGLKTSNMVKALKSGKTPRLSAISVILIKERRLEKEDLR